MIIIIYMRIIVIVFDVIVPQSKNSLDQDIINWVCKFF